jgi:hypothetical protein
MNINRTLISTAVIVTLSLAAAPAGAQDQRGSGHQRGGGRATASAPAPRQNGAQRAVPRQAAPQGRQNASRQPENRQYSAPAPRALQNRQYSAPASRAYANRQYAAPAPRAYDSRSYQSQQRAMPRAYGQSSYRPDDRRGYAQSRSNYRSYGARPYSYSRPYVRPYNYAAYRPFRFSRPYYSFLPRLSLGFGLWLGNPVPYPWSYLGDYRPRVYGDYPEESYDVTAGAPVYGGASFDIQPNDADLFVDGEYVGPIGNFTPNSEPLTLTPGDHRIAVQREGFRPMEWDVTIEPGQVIPYRGAMERY